MKVHANAALGPAGRLALVEAIESGMTQKAAATFWWRPPPPAAGGTAGAWQVSWSADLAPGYTIASRPHRQPRRLSDAEEKPILKARRQTNLGPGP